VDSDPSVEDSGTIDTGIYREVFKQAVMLEEADAVISFAFDGFYNATATDTDGDGQSEIAFTVTDEESWRDHDGDIHVTAGMAILVADVTGELTLEDEAIATVHGETDHYAEMLATGDVDGDGLQDWVLGARSSRYAEDFSGAVYLFADHLEGDLEEADATATIWGDEYLFSNALSAGDTDGDGCDDILIGDYLYEGTGSPYAGRALLVQGPLQEDITASEANAVVEGTKADGTIFASAVSAEADLNGDGLNDAVLGSDSYQSSQGRICLFYGPLEGTSSADDADGILEGECAYSQAGQYLSAGGDADGDGYDDVLVSAVWYASYSGRVYYVRGPVEEVRSLSDADAIFYNNQASADMGRGLSINQDLDDDGVSDLVMGATDYSVSLNDHRGVIFLFHGPQEGLREANEADVAFHSESEDPDYGFLGDYVVGLGDTDGDDVDDLLIGCAGTGPAFLFRGPL